MTGVQTCALPICYPFQFGFVNFALSMGLALCLFALWLRMAKTGRLTLRAAVFVPLSCLLWVCHTFGWGVLGVLAFSSEMIRQHDSRGRSIPGSDATSRAPVPGQDLVLTVNRSLQFEVEQALVARLQKVKGAGGSVVVMDSRTGDIYAAANALRDKKDPTKVAITNANLAAVEAFEPGSVAKVFSLAATVDSGVANPDTEIDVPGALVFDPGTKWKSTISDAEVQIGRAHV